MIDQFSELPDVQHEGEDMKLFMPTQLSVGFDESSKDTVSALIGVLFLLCLSVLYVGCGVFSLLAYLILG